MGGPPSWRGVAVCTCMPALLDDLAAGTPTLPRLTPVKGSYSPGGAASAHTHDAGGAVDLSIAGWTAAQVWQLLKEARARGLVLWHRTAAQSFTPHAHGIVAGCPHLSGLADPVVGTAAWQIKEYRAGRNGLASRGPDDGPRDHVDATWWTYQQEEQQNMPTAAEIAAAVWSHIIPARGAAPYTTGPAAACDWLADARVLLGAIAAVVNALPADVHAALADNDVDPQVLAAAVANAIPPGIAALVADELTRRLAT